MPRIDATIPDDVQAAEMYVGQSNARTIESKSFDEIKIEIQTTHLRIQRVNSAEKMVFREKRF